MSAREFVLTAQPIDEMGVIGFADRRPIEASGPDVHGVFKLMAHALANESAEFDAWDLTLTIKEQR